MTTYRILCQIEAGWFVREEDKPFVEEARASARENGEDEDEAESACLDERRREERCRT